MTQASIYPGEVFAKTDDFDTNIRQLIPYYDEMLDAVARCLPVHCRRVLDLGCGTGELSAKILERHADVSVVAIDYSPRMIEYAGQKLGKTGRFSAVEMDFGDWAIAGNDKVGEDFDAVVSSLAIHHLSNEMKQKLFVMAGRVLNPGGFFWNADPLLPDVPELQDSYQEARNTRAQERGIDLETVRAKMGKSDRQGHSSHDHLATLDQHLEMLRTAGFSQVIVPWKFYNYAVFGGKI